MTLHRRESERIFRLDSEQMQLSFSGDAVFPLDLNLVLRLEIDTPSFRELIIKWICSILS